MHKGPPVADPEISKIGAEYDVSALSSYAHNEPYAFYTGIERVAKNCFKKPVGGDPTTLPFESATGAHRQLGPPAYCQKTVAQISGCRIAYTFQNGEQNKYPQ